MTVFCQLSSDFDHWSQQTGADIITQRSPECPTVDFCVGNHSVWTQLWQTDWGWLDDINSLLENMKEQKRANLFLMNILMNNDRSAFIVLILFVLLSGRSTLYENINPDLQDAVQQQVYRSAAALCGKRQLAQIFVKFITSITQHSDLAHCCTFVWVSTTSKNIPST